MEVVMEINFTNYVFVNGNIYSYGEEVETGKLFICIGNDAFRVKDEIPHTDEEVIKYIIKYNL